MIAILFATACSVTHSAKVDLRGGGSAYTVESLRCTGDEAGMRVRDAAGKEVLLVDALDGLERFRFHGRDYLLFSTRGPHGGVPSIYGWVGARLAELVWPGFREIERAAHLPADREIRDRAMALEARSGKLYFLCRAWKRDQPMASDTIGVEALVEPDPERGVLRVIRARRIDD